MNEVLDIDQYQYTFDPQKEVVHALESDHLLERDPLELNSLLPCHIRSCKKLND